MRLVLLLNSPCSLLTNLRISIFGRLAALLAYFVRLGASTW